MSDKLVTRNIEERPIKILISLESVSKGFSLRVGWPILLNRSSVNFNSIFSQTLSFGTVSSALGELDFPIENMPAWVLKNVLIGKRAYRTLFQTSVWSGNGQFKALAASDIAGQKRAEVSDFERSVLNEQSDRAALSISPAGRRNVSASETRVRTCILDFIIINSPEIF